MARPFSKNGYRVCIEEQGFFKDPFSLATVDVLWILEHHPLHTSSPFPPMHQPTPPFNSPLFTFSSVKRGLPMLLKNHKEFAKQDSIPMPNNIPHQTKPLVTFSHHDPLSNPSHQIRLRHIAPDRPNDALEVALTTHPLHSTPPYRAISYVRGDDRTELITVDQ